MDADLELSTPTKDEDSAAAAENTEAVAEAESESPTEQPKEEQPKEGAAEVPVESEAAPFDVSRVSDAPPVEVAVTPELPISDIDLDEAAKEPEFIPIPEITLKPLEPKRTLSDNFKEIILQIESQNCIINTMKNRIKEKLCQKTLTICEQNEIQNLNICIQEECGKLQCLLTKAICLQEQDPHRRWPIIELATTYLEETMPIQIDAFRPVEIYREQCDENKDDFKCHPDRKETSSKSISSDRTTCTEIFGGVEPNDRRPYRMIPRKEDPLFAKLRPENRKAHSLDPKKRKLPQYANYEMEKRRKSPCESNTKEDIVYCLQKKIDRIQKELTMLDREANTESDSKQRSNDSSEQWGSKSKKHELSRRKNGTVDQQKIINCCKKCKCRASMADSFVETEPDDIRSKYCELLDEICCKDREITKLKASIELLTEGGSKDSKDPLEQAAEVRVLRHELQQCREDRDDFKVMVCEQARQIDDYRIKYMSTLTKFEEQRCLLQKMEMDNKHIEDQINLEIQRIKMKFAKKLEEYSRLPTLLENEQIKLAECCRIKNDLDMKLRLVCREYKVLKIRAEKSASSQNFDDPETCKRLSDEVAKLKQDNAALKECKERLSEEYDKTKNELDMLRSESAKMILRLKERSGANQLVLGQHINNLESDLAKCRAAARLSISDRDGVIKDMQSQLNVLGLSFDSAQNQIKTLKDHISYLSNGKTTNSIVISMQADSGNGKLK